MNIQISGRAAYTALKGPIRPSRGSKKAFYLTLRVLDRDIKFLKKKIKTSYGFSDPHLPIYDVPDTEHSYIDFTADASNPPKVVHENGEKFVDIITPGSDLKVLGQLQVYNNNHIKFVIQTVTLVMRRNISKTAMRYKTNLNHSNKNNKLRRHRDDRPLERPKYNPLFDKERLQNG